jgi:hypothetical protein
VHGYVEISCSHARRRLNWEECQSMLEWNSGFETFARQQQHCGFFQKIRPIPPVLRSLLIRIPYELSRVVSACEPSRPNNQIEKILKKPSLHRCFGKHRQTSANSQDPTRVCPETSPWQLFLDHGEVTGPCLPRQPP